MRLVQQLFMMSACDMNTLSTAFGFFLSFGSLCCLLVTSFGGMILCFEDRTAPS